MYYKKLIRKPQIETVEDFQQFLFKCSVVLGIILIAVFSIMFRSTF